MSIPLNEVFKTSGVPTHTFVPPTEYTRLIVNLQTPGRGLVVEGPSGIGKTTAIERALEEVGMHSKITKLSARRAEDVEYIGILPDLADPGVVLIDDFHRLDALTQGKIADYVKFLADRELPGTKVIVIGINNAGQSLIQFASDLVNRVDIIQFEQNPDEKVEELIDKGAARSTSELQPALK